MSGVLAVSGGEARAGQATASSLGGLNTNTDASNFLFARGTGTNCVHVDARGTAAASLVDPAVAGAGPCGFTAGLLFIAGLGMTATKPTGIPAPTFTNTATRGGVTSTASALFTYATGAILDTATYFATANVTGPASTAVRFAGPDVAWGNAEDPIVFSSSSSFLPFGANLTQLSLTSVNGESGFFADYSLDGQAIFSFDVIAPTNFSDPSQIEISYTSMLGTSFDLSELSTIRSNQSINATSETVSLTVPSLTLFPMTPLAIGPGSHQLVGGEAVVAAAGVPEPSTVTLLFTGLFVLGGLQYLRRLAVRTERLTALLRLDRRVLLLS